MTYPQDLPGADDVPPVRQSDEQPPERIGERCPITESLVVMDEPEADAVPSTHGAFGKYVAYYYECGECNQRHQFQWAGSETSLESQGDDVVDDSPRHQTIDVDERFALTDEERQEYRDTFGEPWGPIDFEGIVVNTDPVVLDDGKETVTIPVSLPDGLGLKLQLTRDDGHVALEDTEADR